MTPIAAAVTRAEPPGAPERIRARDLRCHKVDTAGSSVTAVRRRPPMELWRAATKAISRPASAPPETPSPGPRAAEIPYRPRPRWP